MEKGKSGKRVPIPAHVLRHFRNQWHSGLSIRAYCHRSGISSWTFYNWRKFYKEPTPRSSTSTKKATLPVSFSTFGPFSVNPGLCDIRLPSGITVTVHRGASREELLPIILALAGGEAPC
jgi:hypothetical protein